MEEKRNQELLKKAPMSELKKIDEIYGSSNYTEMPSQISSGRVEGNKLKLYFLGSKFQYILALLAIVNLICSIAEIIIDDIKPDKNKKNGNRNIMYIFEIINIIILCFFLIESIIRCCLLGWKKFIRSLWSLIDFFVVLICLSLSIYEFFEDNVYRVFMIVPLLTLRLFYAFRILLKIQNNALLMEDALMDTRKLYYAKLKVLLEEFQALDQNLEEDLDLTNRLIKEINDKKRSDETALMVQSKKSWDSLVPPTTSIRIKTYSVSSIKTLSGNK